MSQVVSLQGASAPPFEIGARDVIRWIMTNNPFYVISAGLFLAGLWISFGDQAEAESSWALMSGLAGYTLLLAGTALLLVRFYKIWDDVRTVLLLVVLMFLATSVTFDEVLVSSTEGFTNPGRGFGCFLGGLAFALIVSEVLLRGLRLQLPSLYRMPYYLVLSLFFLYPLFLHSFGEPHTEERLWGLFCFSAVAGILFLTLIPAIRRGPAYVLGNGSPWAWPFYPWALFFFLALAVVGRAVLLCYSMHGPMIANRSDQLIFGPYFLVPFGTALAVLLLEGGIVAKRADVMRIALLVPVGLLFLTFVGHRADPLYGQFLRIFESRLGGSPPVMALMLECGFYFYAVVRRVPRAAEALTTGLTVLGYLIAHSFAQEIPEEYWIAPVACAAAVQFVSAMRRQRSWRFLIAVGLAAIADYGWLKDATSPRWQQTILAHFCIASLLIAGELFQDLLAKILRIVAPILAAIVCLIVIFNPARLPGIPLWVVNLYPPCMAMLLAGYGMLPGRGHSLAIAAIVFASWALMSAWWLYLILRRIIAGLDYLVLSLPVLFLAILISVWKAKAFTKEQPVSTQSG